MLEQLNSVHGGHAIIHHETSYFGQPLSFEKTNDFIKWACLKTFDFKNETQRGQDGRIVLDNQDKRTCPRHHFDRSIWSARESPRQHPLVSALRDSIR